MPFATIGLLSLAASLSQAEDRAPRWTSCSSYRLSSGPEIIVDNISFVFFRSDSANIDATGRTMLDAFVARYAAPSGCRVGIVATTDRAGAAGHNLRLSRRRARAVEAYLRQRGLSAPIVIEAVGETRLLVETHDGVAEPQNRHVTVYVREPA